MHKIKTGKEIIKLFEKETGKKALKGNVITKQFLKWQDKKGIFALSETVSKSILEKITNLENRIKKLEKAKK